MKYFSPDFTDFFKELAANNNKEWFDKNRKRYTTTVKEPFQRFVGDIIEEIGKLDSSVKIEPKDAIFRINRDIRFSKDKSPYKLDRTAIISSAGRKDHSIPGFYMSLSPEKVMFGGGAYSINSKELDPMRDYMVKNYEQLQKIMEQENFKQIFSEIKGEEHQRLPAKFKDMGEEYPLLYKKQFYYMVDSDPELILSNDLKDVTLQYYEVAVPMQKFLTKALSK